MKMSKSIAAHIEDFPPHVQKLLEQMRKAIKEAAPDAEETISYGIPTFKLNGNLVHFGGFAKHVSFFPGAEAIAKYKKELSKYKTSKGTIQFALDEKLPLGLIKKITKYRVKLNKARKKR